MYTIGVLAFSEYVLTDVTELERSLTRFDYPVHIEQMRGKPEPSQLADFYYEENAILLWLCRCHGDEERCREAVECFIDAKVDLLIAMTPLALKQALSRTTESKIPIVFTHVSKSQYNDFCSSLSHPESLVKGVYDVWADLVEERVALLTEVVPPPRTVHTFFNDKSPQSLEELGKLQQACNRLGLELFPHITRTVDDVKEVLSSLKPRPDHAVFRMSDPMLNPISGLTGAIAHEHYIPYMGLSLGELEGSGSLFSLEPEGIGKYAASLVDSALREVDWAAAESVEPPGKIMSVNLQAAQNLGLVVSPAVLKQAANIIPARERRLLGSRLRTILVPATLIISIIAVAAFYLGVVPLFGLILLSTAGLALSVTLYLHHNIIRPLNRLSLAAEKIGAGEMDTPIIEVTVEDEVSTLARALRRMKSNLKNSYAELEELTHNLEIRVEELTEANRALRHAQHEIEIAGRRIVEAEDSARFALTTFIHDEILGPLDDLTALSLELNDADIQDLAHDLETRMRQLRFNLSVPILQDLGVELRRLVQEALPMIYPNAAAVKMDLDLSGLDRLPEMEPASVFLLYRFVHGAVSNVYRHSGASEIKVRADSTDDGLSLLVMDNGHGFNLDDMDQFIKNGHYFFHDIQIRAHQLKGEFRVQSGLDAGTLMQVSVPVKRNQKSVGRDLNRFPADRSQ